MASIKEKGFVCMKIFSSKQPSQIAKSGRQCFKVIPK